MKSKRKPPKTATCAPRKEIQPTLSKALQRIVQTIVMNANEQICEVNHARHSISKIDWYSDKPVELFWNKTSIKQMKRLFGDNFTRGEQILRKLTMINFEIGVIYSELHAIRYDLETLMKTEKTLTSQIKNFLQNNTHI